MAGRHRWFLWTRGVRVGVWIAGWGRRRDITTLNGSSGFDGINDLLVPRATAKVAFDGASDFLTGGIVVLIEEGLRCHQKSRRAEAALGAAMCRKAGLNRGEVGPVRQTFDGDDVFALNLASEGQTG